MSSETATNFRRNLSTIIESAVAGNPTVITKHGKTQAAVISAADYELFLALRDANKSEVTEPTEVK